MEQCINQIVAARLCGLSPLDSASEAAFSPSAPDFLIDLRTGVEVPPSLGSTAPGLGPMPESAGGRRTLDKALDDMAGKPGAAVVCDCAQINQ